MWYVMQTMTGKENETKESIERVLRGRGYQRCFVILQECVWRLGGRIKLHEKPLFPSYVFIDTDTPEELYLALKKVPAFTKLLEGEDMFLPIWEEEQHLMEQLFEDPDHPVIRRIPVTVNEEGEITGAEGFLGQHLGHIIKQRLRKRNVTIEIPFLGEMRRIQLGIRVEGEE